jgi:uncharacterized protein YjbJ (UPF0337 family)
MHQDSITGNWDELLGHIQKVYGYTKEKAWGEIEAFKKSLKKRRVDLSH